MGQTLTHGIYLPDEGERNCYSGLAANWQILDSSVGTIAAHTAALAGKAPLVHTHVKSDITDFPVYGTTAGTICEGNDSRLSDARTPVAHTHGKADITDLFNSANTWSNGNSFQYFISLNGDRNAYIVPMWAGAASGMSFLTMDATKQFVFGQRTTDANNRYVYDPTKGFLVIRTGETGGSNYVEVIPYGSDTRLGDSTNKWKSLNGVNPGALSFFDASSAGDIINTNNWNTNGGGNEYTPTENGWVYFRIAGVSGNYIVIRYNDQGQNYPTISQEAVSLHLSVCAPAIAGLKMYIYVIGSIEKAYFYPALGNV